MHRGGVPLNRRGISALADALLFTVLVAVAANLMLMPSGAGDGGAGDDVQDPSQVIEAVMASRMDYRDIGSDIRADGSAPMCRLAYVSMCLGDGRFMDYLERVLESAYPWDSSFHVSASCSKGAEERGQASGSCWRSFERSYETGFSDPLTISVEVFRRL